MGKSGAERAGIVDLKQALSAGAVAAVVAALAVGTTGVASGAEARALLQSVLPTIRFLTSAVITASATIMALMLTILSLSQATDSEFRRVHYQRVKQIGTWSTVAIVGGTFFLLFLSVPTGESDVLAGWYEAVYYGIVLVSCLLGGLQIAVVLMLRKAITGMVGAIQPEGESEIVRTEEEAPEEQGGSRGR